MVSALHSMEPTVAERVPEDDLYIVRTTGKDFSSLIPLQAVDASCVALKFCFKAKPRNKIVSDL